VGRSRELRGGRDLGRRGGRGADWRRRKGRRRVGVWEGCGVEELERVRVRRFSYIRVFV
jgi:hypothetical protein